MWTDNKIRQKMMMDGKTLWTEERVKELIELYHQYTLLWDSRNPDYKNRAKKNEALKEMGCILNCETLEVERKLQVVLAQYRRTRLKINNLKRVGAPEEEMEKNLWYGYKLLRFLEDRGFPDNSKNVTLEEEISRGERFSSDIWLHFIKEGENGICRYCDNRISIAGGSSGNLNRHLKSRHSSLAFPCSDTTNSPQIEQDNLHQNYSSDPVVVLVDASDFSDLKVEPDELPEQEEEIDHPLTTLVPQQTTLNISPERRGAKRGKKMFENREDDRFKIMANASSSVPTRKDLKDEYSLFGEQLAFKLRKMDPIMRLETQHKINCIVFESEMKMAKKPDSGK